jgi:hypothetical protein
MTMLKERVAEIRPIYLEPDPFQRTNYRPGELAQWHIWFPDAEIPVGYGHAAKLPVIVGVAGYSRVIVGRIPSLEAPDLLLGTSPACVISAASPERGSTTTKGRSAKSAVREPCSPAIFSHSRAS